MFNPHSQEWPCHFSAASARPIVLLLVFVHWNTIDARTVGSPDLQECRQRRTPFRFSFYFTRRVKRHASNRVISRPLNLCSAMPACRYRSGSIWQPFFVLGVCLVLAVRLFRQVSQYAVNIFFSDQWAIHEATLFQKHTLWEMFHWRYDAHRLGVGGLLSYFLEPHFRWNSRGEAFLATAIVTIAAFCAIYLKTRLWGPICLFDLAIPAIFLTPAQYESLWVTPDYAHGPLPLLLVVLYCVALTCERAAVRYTLVLIVNFLALYTGYGLLMGIITPAWLLLEYYSKRTAHQPASMVLLAFAISVVSLASFLIGYAPESFVDCTSLVPSSPVTYVTFFLGMLAHNFGARGPQIISIPTGDGGANGNDFCADRVWQGRQEIERVHPQRAGARSFGGLLPSFLCGDDFWARVPGIASGV